MKNSSLTDELEKIAEKSQSLVRALLVAFNAASIEENAVLNGTISSVFHSSSLDESIINFRNKVKQFSNREILNKNLQQLMDD